MFFFFSLLLFTIGLLTISMMSGQRQRFSVQAIEGVLEALIMNILLLLLVAMLGSSLNAQAKYVLGYLIRFHVIQLLYVMLRSLFLRRQQRWAKLKGLITGNILIVLSVYLFFWLLQSIPWED